MHISRDDRGYHHVSLASLAFLASNLVDLLGVVSTTVRGDGETTFQGGTGLLDSQGLPLLRAS